MKELDELIKSFFKDANFESLPNDYAERDFEREVVQKNCALIEIKNNTPNINAPYKDSHGRYPDFEYCLHKFLEENKVEDFKFLVVLNDGMKMKVPSLSPNRLDKSFINNIPIPMGNQRGLNSGCGNPIKEWDEYIKKNLSQTHHSYPWSKKLNKVVFRGQFSWQTWALGKFGQVKAKKWSEINRGVLYNKCKNNNLFDIGFNKVNCSTPYQIENFEGEFMGCEEIPIVDPIPFADQQKYKFMINVGNNMNWAERLRLHFFTNSVTVLHGSECIEWFYPLLKPYVHYIPTNIMFDDLEENINWALSNDPICQQIVENANNFAKKYINEKTIHYVFAETLKYFSKLL